MNVVAEIQRINDLELGRGLTHTAASWHAKYKDSAWVYTGNLPHNLSDGDVLCILSQFGEIDDINLARDGDSGKSKGFAFVKYEDARSCVLAVDNLTGSQVLGRTLRVDHVEEYRLPKHIREKRAKLDRGDTVSSVAEAGHAYEGQELANSYDLHSGQDPFAAPSDGGRDGGRKEGPPAEDGVGNDKKARRHRKELRARKRREKERRRQEKDERKRRKQANHEAARSRRVNV